jgi:peptide chain release factor 1
MIKESGVHCVQRLSGLGKNRRMQTSTASVIVLHQVQEVELRIQEKDLRIDTFKSQGKGGQHVNTTDSAVRVTHLPTGIVSSSQDCRSQGENKKLALNVLRSRLFDFYEEQQNNEISQTRKSQVNRGDRSEKMRTYNFPENRITDHRLNLKIYQLEKVLKGDLSLLHKKSGTN